MTQLGYTLSSEEHSPTDLVTFAQRADEVGFDFASISDHFHPWSEKQGQSSFVYSVIGAISQVTKQIEIGIGVTCPIIRYHPAIIAQASATCSLLLDGRFFLGIGSGENLNEHVIGAAWPPVAIRQEMMIEAIEMIRLLWKGEYVDYYGNYYTLDKAKLYSAPTSPIPLIISGYGPKATEIAGELGDGFWNTNPDKELSEQFEKLAGKEKPKYIQITVSYDTDEKRAIQTAYDYWGFTALSSPLNTELRLPSFFDKAVEKLVKPEDITKDIICGVGIEKYKQKVTECLDAGYDHIYFHQVGPNQEAFLTFAHQELLPTLKSEFVK